MILFWLLILLPLPVLAEVDPYQVWHQVRLERLTKPDGWLSLCGLHWLDAERAPLGDLGEAQLVGERVKFWFPEGVSLNGKSVRTASVGLEKEGSSLFAAGTKRFYVIRRGDRVGVRVKDLLHPRRLNFKGIERFAADPRWRLEGKLVAAAASLVTESVAGVTTEEPSPGWAQFSWQDRQYRVRLTGKPEAKKFFLVFSDATSGHSTYGACRFLYLTRVGERGLIIDFNQAYNPPCAFSEFATCPLPYPENRLDFAVEAGEKKPRKAAAP